METTTARSVWLPLTFQKPCVFICVSSRTWTRHVCLSNGARFFCFRSSCLSDPPPSSCCCGAAASSWSHIAQVKVRSLGHMVLEGGGLSEPGVQDDGLVWFDENPWTPHDEKMKNKQIFYVSTLAKVNFNNVSKMVSGKWSPGFPCNCLVWIQCLVKYCSLLTSTLVIMWFVDLSDYLSFKQCNLIQFGT